MRTSIALWALSLGVLASQVMHGRLRAFDQDWSQLAAAWRSPAWDPLMRALAFFGSTAWAALALAALAAWAWRRGRRHAAWIVVAACAFGLGLEIALRFWVAQWRPDVMSVPAHGLIERFHAAGFPSGHAFRSAFLFGWIIKELRARPGWQAWAGQAVCVVLIVLVGAGRLYLSRHWASDVLGAWLAALLALSVAAAWERAFKNQSVVRRP